MRKISLFLALFILSFANYLPIFLNPNLLLNRDNDLEEFFWPIFNYVKYNIYLSKEIPLWNNLFFSGTPLVTDPQSGIFYLPNLLFLLFPIDFAFLVSLLIHITFGGINMYFLAKKGFNFQSTASFFTAVLFIMYPKIAGFTEAGHFGLIIATTWVPLAILSTIQLSKSPSLLRAIILAMSLSAIFFNHLIIFVVTTFFLCLLFLYISFTERSFKKIVLMAYALTLTFGLAAVTLLPQIDWIPQTTRSLLLKYPDVYPKWAGLDEFVFSIIFPWRLGISQIDSEKWLATGLIPILLAFLGFLFLKRIHKFFLMLLIILILIISLNNLSPLYPKMINQNWFVLMRVATRVFFVIQISIIILAGFAVDNFLSKKIINKFILIVLLSLSVIELLILSWSRLSIPIKTAETAPLEVYQFLKSDHSRFRVFCLTRCIPQKTASIYGFELVEGYGTLQQKNYFDSFIQLSQVFWDKYTLSLPPFEIYEFTKIQPITSEIADYNVKYVISPYKLNDKKLLLKKVSGKYLIYENSVVRSRAYYSDGSDAPILEYSPNHIKIDTSSQKSLDITISEVYNSGWRAKLNGVTQAKITQTSNKLRLVEINKDTKFIEMNYLPKSFLIGRAITFTTFLFCLSVVLIKAKKKLSPE